MAMDNLDSPAVSMVLRAVTHAIVLLVNQKRKILSAPGVKLAVLVVAAEHWLQQKSVPVSVHPKMANLSPPTNVKQRLPILQVGKSASWMTVSIAGAGLSA